MTLGAPPRSIGIRLERGSSSSLEGPSTYPRYRFTTEHTVTTNPESVEHTDPDDDVMLARSLDTPFESPAEGSHLKPQNHAHIDSLQNDDDDELPPVRSKASTPKSFYRHSAYTTPPETESEMEWDVEERGRTRTRLECIVPPRSRQISKRGLERHVGRSTGASGSAEAETFLTSESPSPSNSSKDVQELVLEPSPPHSLARGLSERLSKVVTPASPEEGVPFPRDADTNSKSWRFKTSPDSRSLSTIEPAHFQNHRDTFAILELPKNKPLPPSPPEFSHLSYPILRRLDRFLDHSSRLALRSTCRWLRDAMTEIRPLRFPSVSKLPAELIHEILSGLSPFDFNSARHTCRAWMRVSLDKNLLARMFRKAGWWTSVEKEMRTYLTRSGADEDDISAIWYLSSLLTRECALTSWGTGVGLPQHYIQKPSALKRAQFDGAADEGAPGVHFSSPFELTLETDFSSLSDGRSHANTITMYSQGRGLREDVHFTASICGRFLLVTNGSQIYIYRLSNAISQRTSNDNNSSAFNSGLALCSSSSRTAIIYPVTTIICPRRVLAVSMDTSCGRHAVAALLDDRMGLVCDIFGSGDSSPSKAFSNESPFEAFSMYPHRASQPGYTSVVTPGFLRSTSNAALFGQESPTMSPQLLPSQQQNQPRIAHTYPIPIETGPRSIYRALCSNDDPPLSIAICPQRRCVAFGCASGIELHWVDALTGQDLNRWFPLTSPSDYLYFLPPRKGIDNAKKLRLVSSSGLLGMKGRLRERFTSLRSYNWGSAIGMGFGYGGWRDSEIERDSADNYRSVPLSDGNHVLFTDPIDQKLCLGIDAPLFGPNRMAKKVVFEGPKGIMPGLYAAGRDLTWGVRVVVGYGDEIWLFTVPADMFLCEGNGDREPWLEQYVSPNKLSQVRSMRAAKALLADTPIATSVDDHDASEDSTSVWPIILPGIPIATVPDLSELTINSRQTSFTIWAFATDGMARAWQIQGAKSRRVKTATVLRDGSVLEEGHEGTNGEEGEIRLIKHEVELDADGDVIMDDAPPLTEISLPGLEWTSHTSYDGYMSRSSSLNPSRKPSRRFSVRAGHEAPPTTPLTANSPAAPATPILHGVDDALREPSASPITLSPSLRSGSSPLPNIVEHELPSIDELLSTDLDSESYWVNAGEDAKKEAERERMAGLIPQRHFEAGHVSGFGSGESGDYYGLGYAVGSSQEELPDSGYFDVEILW